jgi:MFS family permease
VAVSADIARLAAIAPEYARKMALHEKRNVLFLIFDGATFSFAISLLSETTIIPAFMQRLSGSAILVGLVAAVYALGHYLPQLFGAHLALGREKRKYLMLTIVILERVGILAIAIAAQLVGTLDRGVVIALFFVAFGIYSITTGLTGPVYGDFVSKALNRSRGWYYGVVQFLGGSLGFAAALVAQQLIKSHAFPQGNQLCFWLCFSLSFFSIVFVSCLKEEPYPHVEPRPRFRDTLAKIPALIAGDRSYARYLVARCALALSTLGVGFVVVDGLHHVLSPSDAALLAAVFILSQAVLGFVLSLVGSRFGWRIVIILGGVLIALGMVGALVGGSLLVYMGVFVLLGGANAVTIVGDTNMSIEFAPTAKTSLYIGTTSTLLAPFFIFGPLIAGVLANDVSFPLVFAIAGVLAVVGVVLALRIQEPRKSIPADLIDVDITGQPGTLP